MANRGPAKSTRMTTTLWRYEVGFGAVVMLQVHFDGPQV
jgi:hypothetical protein